MPQAFWTAIAAKAAAVTAGQVLFFAAVTVYGVYTARSQARKAKQAFKASLQDRKITVRSGVAPRAFVFGQDVLSGPLVYAREHGEKSEPLSYVVALTGHPVEAINEVHLDGKPLGALDGNGYVTGGEFFLTKEVNLTYRTTGVASGSFVTLPKFPQRVWSVAIESVQDQVPHESYEHNLKLGEDWYSDDDRVHFTSSKADGKRIVITYKYDEGTPLVQVRKLLGSLAGERDTELETFTDNHYSATRLGKGVSRVRVTLKHDRDVMGGAIPNTSALVQGMLLYDPRSLQTEWSENPILAMNAYLRMTEGFNVSAGEIDSDYTISEANVCDEMVEYKAGLFQKRFTCNGTIYTDAAPRDNLQALLSSCVGAASYSAGKWRLSTASHRQPVALIEDEDVLLNTVQTVASSSYRDLYNAVRGQYISKDDNYALTDFPPYVSATYVAEDDGETIFKDVEFAFCNDPHRAQRMAKLMLFVDRQAVLDIASYRMRMLPLQPNDFVDVTRSFDGWDEKPFRVVSRKFDPSIMQVGLTLKEEAEATYDEDFAEWLDPDPAPNTNFPNPRIVNAITGLVATSGAQYFDLASDSTVLSYVLLEWDEITTSDVLIGGHIRVMYKRATETTYTEVRLDPTATSMKISPVFAGQLFNVDIVAVNGSESVSPVTTITHEVDSGTLPSGAPATSGNLLIGASFSAGTFGWVTANQNAPINLTTLKSRVGFFRATSPGESLPGAVDNAILDLNKVAPPPNVIVAFSAPILIDVKRAYYFQALVKGCYAQPRLGMIFHDFEGNFVNFILINSGVQKTSREAFPVVPGAANLTSDDIQAYYEMNGVVPISSFGVHTKVVGRFVVQGVADISLASYGGRAFVSVAQPMILQADAGTNAPAPRWFPWQPGREDYVTPDRIVPGMQGYSHFGETSVNLPFALTTAWQTVSNISIENDGVEDTSVEVLVSADLEVAQKAGEISKILLRVNLLSALSGGAGGITTLAEPVLDASGQSEGTVRRLRVSTVLGIATFPDLAGMQAQFALENASGGAVRNIVFTAKVVK